MDPAGVLASCGPPGLCHSATECVVAFPRQHTIPSCLGRVGRGLLAPRGVTSERAAVCQPPPEPSDRAVVRPVVGAVPKAAD